MKCILLIPLIFTIVAFSITSSVASPRFIYGYAVSDYFVGASSISAIISENPWVLHDTNGEIELGFYDEFTSAYFARFMVSSNGTLIFTHEFIGANGALYENPVLTGAIPGRAYLVTLTVTPNMMIVEDTVTRQQWQDTIAYSGGTRIATSVNFTFNSGYVDPTDFTSGTWGTLQIQNLPSTAIMTEYTGGENGVVAPSFVGRSIVRSDNYATITWYNTTTDAIPTPEMPTPILALLPILLLAIMLLKRRNARMTSP